MNRYVKHSNESALAFLLRALAPYSRENFTLAFKPNAFFNELERRSGYSQKTLKHALWRARREGLVAQKGDILQLTRKGRKEARPFIAQRLGKNARLMVIFDIPEQVAPKRQQLRTLLKSLEFKQIQKSVWCTSYDHRAILKEAVRQLGLKDYVEIYESLRLL